MYCVKDLKEGKKIRISEPDVLKKAGQLFTLRLKDALICYVAHKVLKYWLKALRYIQKEIWPEILLFCVV